VIFLEELSAVILATISSYTCNYQQLYLQLETFTLANPTI